MGPNCVKKGPADRRLSVEVYPDCILLEMTKLKVPEDTLEVSRRLTKAEFRTESAPEVLDH